MSPLAEPLSILIASDGNRTETGAEVPHVYATQIEFIQQGGNHVRVFGIDDRTSIRGVLRNVRELRATVEVYRPHLLVAYYGSMVSAVTRLAAGRLPLVVTFRGSDLQGTSNPGLDWRIRDRLGRLLSLWAAAGARRIVVNGSGLYDRLPLRLRHKAASLPNGIDVRVFKPCPRAEARKRLGWGAGELVLLFNAGVGSGQVVKNRPLAEAVVSALKQDFPALRLEAISAFTREEVALRMNASDCLLVTSLHEGSPDLVKEAMACNLPVVSVPCGDVPERLDGVSHSHIRPYDTVALAGAVAGVLRSGERTNGRAVLLAQGLDIPSVTRRVLAVYREAVGDAAG